MECYPQEARAHQNEGTYKQPHTMQSRIKLPLKRGLNKGAEGGGNLVIKQGPRARLKATSHLKTRGTLGDGFFFCLNTRKVGFLKGEMRQECI